MTTAIPTTTTTMTTMSTTMSTTTSDNLLFLLAALGVVGAVLAWGLRALPKENMQILATIPIRRIDGDRWQGLNLTWYGALQAFALVVGVAVALVLSGAAGVPVLAMAAILATLLAVALPSAKLVARLVERRSGTFTVGGGVFVAALLLPWVGLAADTALGSDQALASITAVAIAYPLGEGLGRLACISYGCCYGRRVSDCPGWVQRTFARRPAIVLGPTRKAAYAGHCEGVPLVPVPALSACVLSLAGLAGMGLFLAGHLRSAGMLSLGIAFGWRFASELLRADDRGRGRISTYQWMSLACLVYVPVMLALSPASHASPRISDGLAAMRSPLVALALAGLGLVVFVYLGVSKMTSATLRLEVRNH